MKNVLYALIIVSILIGAGYVLRYCTESSNLPTEIPPNDTLYVYGDTVWIPQDTVYVLRWIKVPAVTTIDSSGMVTKSITKDTLLVVDKDSIGVEVNVDYYPSEDTFDLAMDIDFRGYDSFRIDTLKVTEYMAIEVPIKRPFYDSFVWGAGAMTVIFTALILLLGG